MKFLVSRDVTARSIRTRIVEGGSGPSVLFIHGVFSNHAAFSDVMEQLVEHFHVVAIDLPGFGQSEVPTAAGFSFTPEAFAEVMVDTIAALELGRSHVVGHAFGAAIALALSAQHPELVHHLCLISPEMLRASVPRIERLWLAPVVGLAIFKQLNNRNMFRSFLSKHMYAPGHKISNARLDKYFEQMRAPGHSESVLAVLRGQRDTRPDVARLSRIKSPTLVLAGRADQTLPTDLAHRMVRQIADARVEFLDAGHSPHEEQPQLVAQSLVGFFPTVTDERAK